MRKERNVHGPQGERKGELENIGVMVDDGSPYLLLKPYISLAGFPREEGRSHLLVSVFEHKEQEQRSSRNSDKEDFSAEVQEYNPDKIPF